MDDDLFQSLGGSLMKDLLADLQGDDGEGDGWLSLEQLERELSQLDDGSAPDPVPVNLGSVALPPVPTAASMVVSGQQQQLQQQPAIQGVGLLGDVTVTTAPAVDAWKESLQKFSAMPLAQDFLAADTVRKQQQAPAAAPQLPPGFLAEAQDYDATEKITLKPPPGLLGSSSSAGAPPGIKTATASQQKQDKEDQERETQAKLVAATLLPGAVPSIPPGKPLPKTPQNSVALAAGIGNEEATQKSRAAARMPKTPRNSVIIGSADEAAATAGGPDDDVPMMEKVTILKREQPPAEKEEAGKAKPPAGVPKTPRNSVIVSSQEAAAAAVVSASAAVQGMAMPQPPMMMPGGMPPPHGMPGIPPQGMIPGMPPPQGMPPHVHPGMPPHIHPAMVPPGAPVPVGMPAPSGPAWQTPPRPPPPPPPMKVFCNPHPNAPPIPAQVLESRLMKARDISYIIHSIMKPVLMAGYSENDYDIQFLRRQSGGRPAGPRPFGRKEKVDQQSDDLNVDAIQQEIESREKKSREWSNKNAALGHVAKSNIARPRALIASPVISQANKENSESASEQKQRARLWKARIYCDQAYQAYLAVVDVWTKAAPGSVPREVHAPLIRMMKCLGIAPVTSIPATGDSKEATSGTGGEFKVDASVLELFLKLSKGRTLMARIVEQALLPPSAVQAVLPVTLDILYKTAPGNDAKDSNYDGDPIDDRCFRALTVVIQRLPSLTGEAVLQCAETMKSHSDTALSSTARMECLHALLQRGTAMSNNPDPAMEDFESKWKETESSFMNILSGF